MLSLGGIEKQHRYDGGRGGLIARKGNVKSLVDLKASRTAPGKGKMREKRKPTKTCLLRGEK